MLTIVCFKWKAPPGYRSSFEGHHVDVLRRMVRRHYPDAHRFVCVTDDPSGIRERDVEVYELWPDFASVRNPSGVKNPSCYRRLRVFARNAGEWLGERFVCLDLDVVIVGDMRPVWNRTEDFVIWKSTTAGNFYNGSMFLMRAGARPEVWTDFDPETSPGLTKAARLYGSDQAWIAYRLGGGEAVWTSKDGVYSMRNEISARGADLPPGARIVFFHGRGDPWDQQVYNRNSWIKDHWK